MTVAVYLPILMSVVLALTAGPAANRLPPRGGAWALTVAAVCAAASGLWALSLLAGSLIDDVPGLTGPGLPVNDVLSVAAALVLAWCVIRIGLEQRRQQQLRRELAALLALPGGDLVVLPDHRARAFAVPGRPGRVVVTDTMLRALTVGERRVLLAHERAHLRAAHPAALALSRLAAAANPMLAPVGRAVDFLCEREADERAGAEVGDRRLVATALATAALAANSAGPHGPELEAAPGFQRRGVVARVAALQAPRRGNRLEVLAAVVLFGALAVAAVVDATGDFTGLVTRFLGH